jgi:hypothetical protein
MNTETAINFQLLTCKSIAFPQICGVPGFTMVPKTPIRNTFRYLNKFKEMWKLI